MGICGGTASGWYKLRHGKARDRHLYVREARYTFENLVGNGFTYVDKTDRLWPLVNLSLGSQFFLARPRRFGKSPTVSVLQARFEGRRELFKGLFIEPLWDGPDHVPQASERPRGDGAGPPERAAVADDRVRDPENGGRGRRRRSRWVRRPIRAGRTSSAGCRSSPAAG
ncbi:MAG: AAA family ATPase [Kiritimatiellia bacterium]